MNNGKIKTIDGNGKAGTIDQHQNEENWPSDRDIPCKDDNAQGLAIGDRVRFDWEKDEQGKATIAKNLNKTTDPGQPG